MTASTSCQSSCNLLRVLVEQSPVAIAVCDTNLQYLLASQQWLDDYGLNKEIIGKSYYEVFPDTSNYWQGIHQHCLTGETYKSQGEILELPNGFREWVKWEIKPWRDHSNKIEGLLITSEIVTARKQQEIIWDDIFQLSPDLMCLANFDGYFEKLNSVWEYTLGFSVAELKAKSFLEFVHPEDQQATLAAANRIAQGGFYISFENRYRCKNGSYKWLQWTATPMLEQQKIYAIARDITDKKEAEEALQTQQELLQKVIDTTPHWLFVKDWDGKFILANQAFTRALGTTPQNLVGKSDADFVTNQEQIEQFLRDDRQVMTSLQEKFIPEEPVTTPEGKTHWVQTIKRPLFLPGNSFPYVLISATDVTERKLAEDALRESKRQYRTLTQVSPVGIYHADSKGHCLYANERWCQITGIKQNAALDKEWTEAIHPEDRKRVTQEWYKSITEKTPFKSEFRFQHSNGEVRWVYSQAVVERGLNEKVQGYVGSCTDITERKKAEEEVQKLVALIERSFDFIGIATLQGKPLYINPAGLDLVGLPSLEAAKNQQVIDFFLPKDQAQVQQELIPQVLQQGYWQGEFWFKHFQTKEPISVDFHFFTINNPQTHQPIALATITRDITERKLAEKEKAKLLAILEATTDLVGTADMEGHLTYLNKAGQKMLGISPEENINQLQIKDIIASSKIDWVENTLIPTIVKDGVWAGENIFQHRDGTKIPVSQVAMAHQAENGQVEYTSAVARDIRNRKAAEEALRNSETKLRKQAQDLEQTLQELRQAQGKLVQTEKMSSLGHLVAGVAHEINNPVNFIYGNLSYVEDYAQDLADLVKLYREKFATNLEVEEKIAAIDLDFLLEDLPKLLNSMRVGSERIQQIVSSLRTFSRKDGTEMKNVNIHEGIDSTIMILQHRFKTTSKYPAIKIIKEYGELPSVDCYLGQMNQVFMNLISNAIDAVEERNKSRSKEEIKDKPSIIRICTEVDEQDQNLVRIRIADSGTGIPNHIQSHLFDPFFTTKAIGKGTGLGLSISYQIITEKHQGQLEFISCPGEGTEFSISLPIQQD